MGNKPAAKFKVGVTDASLKLAANPEALLWASELLFDGLQVSIGRKLVDGKLPLSSPGLQKQYLAEAKKQSCPLASLCLDILADVGLKSRGDGQAARFVADSILIAKALGVKVVMLPCLGKQAMQSPAEIDAVADLLKELGPAAAKAHVVLGLATTLSARDNARLLDRTRSHAVQVYYDVGDAAKSQFDVVEELRWLGKSRICELHFKDNPGYLGKGAIDFHPIVDALADIGFPGFVQLETDAPGGDLEMDMIQNLNFVRGLIRERNEAGGKKPPL